MSTPDPRPKMSDVTETQLEILDQYEHHRRTWELELLISGAVIFALLGVPSLLDDRFFQFQVHASKEQDTMLFFTYYYLTLMAYVLIGSFCINLTMRAYWIGLVGLNKVFPDGVRWQDSKDGPISQRISRTYPDLPALIESSDRISSLVFSISFVAIIFFLYSIVAVGGFSLIAWGISALAFKGAYVQKIALILGALLLVPILTCGLWDKALLKKPRKTWEGRWFAKLIHRVLVASSWLTLRPLYAMMQMTLATNLRRHFTVPLAIFSIFGIIGLFAISFSWRMAERLPIDGYRLFPDVAVERGIDYRHYESLQTHAEIVRRAPSIQSDIIADPFVRLFIPYSPRFHNRKLAALCADVAPIPGQAFRAPSEFNMRPPDESIHTALDCLDSFHQVFLNDQLLDVEYDFFTRAETGVRGIVAYLPIDGLPRGRNALRIEQVKVEQNGEEDTGQVVYFIPFWL